MSQLGSKPQTNALAEMASNPVTAAYNEMFGGGDYGGGSEGGVSSGVSSGVSGGTSQGSKPGMDSHPSFDMFGLGSRGSVLGKVGTGLGIATRGAVPGLGMAFGALGTLGDIEEANAHLASRGLPNINTTKALISSLAPFGLLDHWSPEQQYNNSYGFSDFGPVGGMGFDDPGAGYGFSDFGPVGGFGFDDAQPEGFSGFDDNSGDLGGPSSGDIDDEAAGESDMGQDDY